MECDCYDIFKISLLYEAIKLLVKMKEELPDLHGKIRCVFFHVIPSSTSFTNNKVSNILQSCLASRMHTLHKQSVSLDGILQHNLSPYN